MRAETLVGREIVIEELGNGALVRGHEMVRLEGTLDQNLPVRFANRLPGMQHAKISGGKPFEIGREPGQQTVDIGRVVAAR